MAELASDFYYQSLIGANQGSQSSYTSPYSTTGVGINIDFCPLPKKPSLSFEKVLDPALMNLVITLPRVEYELSEAEDNALWAALRASTKVVHEGKLV